MIRVWLDSWSGVGYVVDAMTALSLGYDARLCHQAVRGVQRLRGQRAARPRISKRFRDWITQGAEMPLRHRVQGSRSLTVGRCSEPLYNW